MENKQTAQKEAHDKHAKEHVFQPNQKVWVRDYRGTDKWAPGEVIKPTGPVSYEIEVRGQSWRRHADQVVLRVGVHSNSPMESAATGDGLVIPDTDLTVAGGESPSEQSVDPPVAPQPVEPTSPSPTLLRQKSAHVSHPPNRLDYDRPGQPAPY